MSEVNEQQIIHQNDDEQMITDTIPTTPVGCVKKHFPEMMAVLGNDKIGMEIKKEEAAQVIFNMLKTGNVEEEKIEELKNNGLDVVFHVAGNENIPPKIKENRIFNILVETLKKGQELEN